MSAHLGLVHLISTNDEPLITLPIDKRVNELFFDSLLLNFRRKMVLYE